MIRKITGWFILVMVCTSFFTGCISYKRSAVKGAKSVYETFFINDSTDQYFIKPLYFRGSAAIEADFTFRKIHNDFSEVVMNFTVIVNAPQNLENLQLQTFSGLVVVSSIKSLYREKKDEEYVYRYSSVIEYSALKDFICSENPSIRYNDVVLFPSNQSLKVIDSLRSGLFEFEISE